MTEQQSQPVAVPGDDTILPFQLDRLNVRGRVARLDATIDTILSQHNYPPAVSGLVAEATLLTALIGQTIKLRDRFSIQVRGKGGAVTMLATDYFAPASEGEPAVMRAYAAYDAEKLGDGKGIELLGEGLMGVTIDQGTGHPYQGVTPLTGASLADCAEVYFAQSEQIATRFALASAQSQEPGQPVNWRAGGVVLQHLPDASPLMDRGPDAPGDGGTNLMTGDDVAALTGEGDDWRTAALKLETVEELELLGPLITSEQLLVRLFHEDSPRIYPAQAVTFGCTCGAEKLEGVLSSYDRAALSEMVEDGNITADCQFCGTQYVFTLEQLIEGGASPQS
jgi:molecular chaperone Hsp33